MGELNSVIILVHSCKVGVEIPIVLMGKNITLALLLPFFPPFWEICHLPLAFCAGGCVHHQSH